MKKKPQGPYMDGDRFLLPERPADLSIEDIAQAMGRKIQVRQAGNRCNTNDTRGCLIESQQITFVWRGRPARQQKLKARYRRLDVLGAFFRNLSEIGLRRLQGL